MQKRQMQIESINDILVAMTTTTDLAHSAGYTEHEARSLMLATEEACTNAYEHASLSKEGPSTITWRVSPSFFEMVIKQKATLFELPVNGDEVNTGLRGRGLSLIVNIMDSVEIIQESPYLFFQMRKERVL